MKFAMVIVTESEPPSPADREFDHLVRWWADLRAQGKLVASARLAPPRTASTVSWRDRVPVVTDGPYVEAKEVVGGFVLVEVESEAEALQIARSMPGRAGMRIELRRVLSF